MAGIGILLIVLCGQSSAQSLGSLSQMFGGGSKPARNSNQSNGAITVTRDASPFVGMFHGKQNTGSADHLSAQFACYPAHDSALPQENTFVCYAPEASSGEPNVSDADKIPQ